MRVSLPRLTVALLATLSLGGCAQLGQKPAAQSQETAQAAAPVAPKPNLPPLPIEETGHTAVLPESYPKDWVLVDEANFFNMFDGKVIILDIAETAQPRRIKGMLHKNLLGNFAQSSTRPELYVMESFHERGWRGKKTDVLTIYDKRTLSIIKEIDWTPTGTERLQALPERYSMAESGDGKFLFVANFNPAASFTVVDLDSHEIVDTISTAGCVLTYPTGERSVASLCSNGGMLTTVLDEDGHMKQQVRMKPFFDTDKTPIFERPAIIDGIAYFPGFAGKVHAIDLRGEKARFLESWNLVNHEEAAANWRPSGLALTAKDDAGLFYVIFQPDGHDGTQSHGGPQVWVYDMKHKQRLRKIDLPNWGISIAVTRGDEPKLVVTNADLNLDIIDARSGEFIQTVSDFGNVTPLLVHKSY